MFLSFCFLHPHSLPLFLLILTSESRITAAMVRPFPTPAPSPQKNPQRGPRPRAASAGLLAAATAGKNLECEWQA